MSASRVADQARRAARIDRGGLSALLTAGLFGGASLLPTPMSMPAVIFTGELERFVGLGIGLGLLGTAVTCVVLAWRSSYPAALGNAHLAPGLVIGLMAGATMQRLGPDVSAAVALGTTLLIIVLSTVSLGLVLLLLGWCRVGNLIRYVPYPVTGGLLAYVAIRLMRRGFEVMLGHELTLESATMLVHLDELSHWLPGLLAATAVMVVQSRRPSHLNIPLAIALATALFWLVAWFAGIQAADLQKSGYLLPPVGAGQLWSPAALLGVLGQADYRAIVPELPHLMVLWLVSAITLLLVASNIEVVTRADMDLNQELKAVGIANLLGGLGAGLPAYHSVSASMLVDRLGVTSRMVGLIGAAVSVLVLLCAAPLIPYLPKLVVGGGVIYLAFEMVAGRVYQQWRGLPAIDQGLLLLVLGSLLAFGFLPGIAIGIVVGIALFAFDYARIDVVRAAGDGTHFRSNVVRPAGQARLLDRHAEAIQVLCLQGYLFFGSAHNLLHRLQASLAPPGAGPAVLILDFEAVEGVDSSALFALTRLAQQMQERGRTILCAAPPAAIVSALPKADPGSGGPQLRIFPDLDHALEQAENAVLGADGTAAPQSGLDELERAYPEVGVRRQLITYGERLTWQADELVLRQGDSPDAILFVESGRLTAWRELPDGRRIRLRTIMPGTVVGEVGFYGAAPRTASIVADREGSAFRITRDALRRMQQDDPRLASLFHHFMVVVIAERAADSMRLLALRAA